MNNEKYVSSLITSVATRWLMSLLIFPLSFSSQTWHHLSSLVMLASSTVSRLCTAATSVPTQLIWMQLENMRFTRLTYLKECQWWRKLGTWYQLKQLNIAGIIARFNRVYRINSITFWWLTSDHVAMQWWLWTIILSCSHWPHCVGFHMSICHWDNVTSNSRK